MLCRLPHTHTYAHTHIYIFHLFVSEPLSISIAKHNSTYKEGVKAITLSCLVDAVSDVNIVWSKGEEVVIMGERAQSMGNGDLVLNSPHGVDSGNYTCTATRGDEVVRATTEVIIEGKEKIIKP